MPSARHHLGDAVLASRRGPRSGPYWSALGARLRGDRAAISAANVSGGNVRRVRQAAGERDDLGPGGDRHEVAHRRGLHDLRARGEQAGVALEVARGARSPMRASSPPAPGPLSSIVMRAAGYRPRSPPMELVLDILQGAGLASADRHPPVPPAAARRRARRAATSAIDFDGTDFAFLESPGVPARACSRSAVVALRGSSARRRTGAPSAVRPRRCSASVGLGALLFAGALADRGYDVRGPGSSAAPLCAALGWLAGARPRSTRARAPARRRGRRRCCPSTPRAPRCCSPALAILVPPLALLAIAGLRRGCCSAAAGARARSTPGLRILR